VAEFENGVLLLFEHKFNDMTMWHRRKWPDFVARTVGLWMMAVKTVIVH
jgi:hypothetical protein